MGKDITCEIVKDYFSVDDNDDSCVKICEVKWNGRAPKGYDIRKYNKENDMLLKGLTVSYDGFKDIVYEAVESGMVDLNEVKRRVSARESMIISDDDFSSIFNNVKESLKYTRKNNGLLVNEDNVVIISPRRGK